jgi:AbrB family looped-hinge helix DNA binding protein
MATNQIVATLADGGRVVIPAEYRKALGIGVGDEVVMFLEGDEIRVVPRRLALKRAQELVRKYAGSRSLKGELVEERREEE